MKLSFRWYGDDDPVTLEKIRQIPNMHTIVTAVYDVPPGEVWSEASIKHLKDRIEENGLHFEVVESVPVHEDIKLGKPTRDHYITNYIENLRRLSKYGVKCVCYNFLPIFDWIRTQTDKRLPDGSTALVCYTDQLAKMDPLKDDFTLPGWDASYSREDMRDLFAEYDKLSEEDIWANYKYFLEKVIPYAEQYDIKMGIHPDDPPYPIFGTKRIIKCEKDIDRALALVDSPYSGLTLCTGALGCVKTNDVAKLVRKYAEMGRIHFMHIRNVKVLDNGSFEETAHFSECGSLDMVGIIKALHDNHYEGYARPDHGRMIWGETGKPGYGLYDRALGASYITGVWDALDKAGL